MIFSVRRPQYLYLLWKHKPVIESNSTTKCGHPSKQEVCFSIQSGYPTLPYRSAGHKVHWYTRLPQYKDIEVVETQSSLEFSWTLKLRSTQVDCFFYDFQGLHLPWNRSSKYFFRKKRIPTGTFFVIQSHTIYDVYHIVVIVHFHQCWCGHTVARLT